MGNTKHSLVFLLSSRIYLINKVTVTDLNARRKKIQELTFSMGSLVKEKSNK